MSALRTVALYHLEQRVVSCARLLAGAGGAASPDCRGDLTVAALAMAEAARMPEQELEARIASVPFAGHAEALLEPWPTAPATSYHVVWRGDNPSPWPVWLLRHVRRRADYAVQYGEQRFERLDWEAACAKVGECLGHALAAMGEL